ncbi:MAE_28990/MAE_18760 family HEPN-like nuclease [Pseudophaeobacter sp.]|uniref:MAE_28990/MAE_18760 family HEPN-like nuclease n=1 Tax=Pseudophaeobacter sp. TaxID=1971739 RepID=UPI004059CA8D
MSILKNFLDDRRVELESHFALAEALDAQLVAGEPVSLGETALSARHLMTVKSGLIVHVYNIVEATMTRSTSEIGRAVRTTSPNEWSREALKEWLRHYASTGIDGNEDSRLEVVHKAALKLLAHDPIDELRFKKPSGSWDDKVIFTFSKRLSISFPLNASIGPKIAKKPKYGDESAMAFLADRRNAIAHGRRSFEDGANDLTIGDIKEIAEISLEYMELAVVAFQKYIDDQKFKFEHA